MYSITLTLIPYIPPSLLPLPLPLPPPPSLSPGMFAIRAERDYVVSEDFMKAVRKVSENKKLETKLDYKQI